MSNSLALWGEVISAFSVVSVVSVQHGRIYSERAKCGTLLFLLVLHATYALLGRSHCKKPRWLTAFKVVTV